MQVERSDAEILGLVPDYVSLPLAVKAAREEGGERILYIEASNEDRDHQGEVVLQKALEDSSSYFLRHGNIDLGHMTLLGPKMGISNASEYEIGKPVDVSVKGAKTFVKAQLYRGESPMARNATMVWDSLHKQTPPMRWYPSVGGAVLAKSVRIDPKTGDRIPVVERVRWNNIALDRCPVNATVPEVSTAPIGMFAKGGFILKTLEAGYGTDSADLTGGAALRQQSLAGVNNVVSYFDFRERLAKAMRERATGRDPKIADLVKYGTETLNLSQDESAEYVDRFMRDLSNGLSQRKAS